MSLVSCVIVYPDPRQFLFCTSRETSSLRFRFLKPLYRFTRGGTLISGILLYQYIGSPVNVFMGSWDILNFSGGFSRNFYFKGYLPPNYLNLLLLHVSLLSWKLGIELISPFVNNPSLEV